MGQRPYPLEEFRSETRVAFAFLVESEGFSEPEDIYTTTGCGPPRDVPGAVHNRRTLLKRVHQYADALCRLLARLPARFPDP